MQEPQDRYEFTVAYAPAMAHRAALLYWRKTHFADFLTVFAGIVFSALLLTAGYVGAWVAWVLISASALLLALQVAVYLVQRRRSLRIIEKMQVRSTVWRLADDSFEVGNQWGQSRLRWPLVKGLLIGTDLWLVMLREGGYLTLPIEDAPAPALEFLRERVAAAGGTLR